MPVQFYGMRKDRFHSDEGNRLPFLAVPEEDRRLLKTA